MKSTIKEQLEELCERWREETRGMSFGRHDDPAYQAIIALGWDAVPFLIDMLREKPDHLGYALHKITGAQPVPREHAGRIDEIAKDWIKWWEQRK